MPPIAGLALVLSGLFGGAASADSGGGGRAPDLAPPFAIEHDGHVRPVWTLRSGAKAPSPQTLDLPDGALAESPSISVTPDVAYRWRAVLEGPLRIRGTWEDAAKHPVGEAAADEGNGEVAQATSVAPANATGLRLRIEAHGGHGRVSELVVAIDRGTAVEPLPDFARAAMAFSFDWESAMGGLIHARSNVTADGSPSVAKAEEMGLAMREGGRFLVALLDEHAIRGSFYATGYNLLRGNPRCRKLLGNPVYSHVGAPWHSNYWQTHPWYGHDPCSTERRAPAWYFGSLARELAKHGEEIGSHTFGHLFMRGASADELAADLSQWTRSARDLGLPPARSFSFPWTGSEGVDPSLFAVLEKFGFHILTRLHQPLAHPYELDRCPLDPALVVFPDLYVRSTPEGRRAALEGIDQVLARRGFFSVWTHPHEIVESPDGKAIWRDVVEAAAARRKDGLWIAPVSDIAEYALATREVTVTSLPRGGRTLLRVENRSRGPLRGLILARSAITGPVTIRGARWSDVRGNRIRLPALAPGKSIAIVTTP